MIKSIYNWIKKRKIWIVFDDAIADMRRNKELNSILTELLITSWKLNISLVFITQFCLAVAKNNRLNSTHYFIMKIPNKTEFQKIICNHSSDINFMNLVIDSTNASNNSSCFRMNLLERI